MNNQSHKKALRDRMRANAPFLFLLSYLAIILIGSLLLMSPMATKSHQPTPWIDSAFVASSALCVTGLTPFTTVTHWSVFGQIVILCLIQLGGLGIMTVVAALGLIVNMHFGMSTRILFMEEKGQDEMTGIVRLEIFILKATLLIEGVGAVLLALDFVPSLGWRRGLWYAIFHSISAFCNAGFDILGSTSMVAYDQNILVLLTSSFLIILGGLGFTVYLNLIHMIRNRRPGGKLASLNLHTRIALSVTGILLGAGTLLIFLAERNNPETLGVLSTGHKWLNAFFQSTSSRTCGYASFDQKAMTNAGSFITILLMFIGGSPAGTAGGIKTTTLAAIFNGFRGIFQKDNDAPIFHRNIPREQIHRSFIVMAASAIWCILTLLLLTVTEAESVPFLDLLFETVSAFGTVGLTRNVTPLLTSLGKFLIMVTMIYGKLGAFTILFLIIPKKSYKKNRMAEESILIG